MKAIFVLVIRAAPTTRWVNEQVRMNLATGSVAEATLTTTGFLKHARCRKIPPVEIQVMMRKKSSVQMVSRSECAFKPAFKPAFKTVLELL